MPPARCFDLLEVAFDSMHREVDEAARDDTNHHGVSDHGMQVEFRQRRLYRVINTNGQTHIVTATMTAKKQPSFGNRCISRSRRDCMVTAGRSDLDILFAFVPIGPFAAGYSRPSRPVTNVYVSSTRAKSRDGNHMPTCLIVPESMREIPERYVDVLREAGFDIAYPKNPELARNLGGESALIDELRGVDATIAGSEGYTPQVLAASPTLRVIARAGVGYDGVNVPAATACDIPVTITPTANREAVAEMTLALMFACSRMIVSNDKLVRAGKWPRRLPMASRGKTIGLFGLGRIGSTMAFRAAALGMRVLATDERIPTRSLSARRRSNWSNLTNCSPKRYHQRPRAADRRNARVVQCESF